MADYDIMLRCFVGWKGHTVRESQVRLTKRLKLIAIFIACTHFTCSYSKIEIVMSNHVKVHNWQYL